MPRKEQGLRTVSIREQLLLEVDKFIVTNPEFAFSSRASFITAAVREKLERHKWGKFTIKF